MPWCETCGCWRAKEVTWSDGKVETRCWTCLNQPHPQSKIWLKGLYQNRITFPFVGTQTQLAAWLVFESLLSQSLVRSNQKTKLGEPIASGCYRRFQPLRALGLFYRSMRIAEDDRSFLSISSWFPLGFVLRRVPTNHWPIAVYHRRGSVPTSSVEPEISSTDTGEGVG